MLLLAGLPSRLVSKNGDGELQVFRTTAAARCAPLRRAPSYCSGIDAAKHFPFYGLASWADHLDSLARIEMEANYTAHASLDPAPSTECVEAMKALTCARYFAPCGMEERRPLPSRCVCASLCHVFQALACPLAESLECSGGGGSSSGGAGGGDALCFSDDAQTCSGYDLSAREIGVEHVIEQEQPHKEAPHKEETHGEVPRKAEDDPELQGDAPSVRTAPAAERLTMAEEDARALAQARATTAAPNGIRIIMPKRPGGEVKLRASMATTASGAAGEVPVPPPFGTTAVTAAALAGARAAGAARP